jgi:hypothetical protein
MTTVWAYRIGAFNSNSDTGWGYTVQFRNIKDLLEELNKRNLVSQIDRLGIVAHGLPNDGPGGVVMDESNMPTPPGSLTPLRPYVKHGGMLEFVSCLAGATGAGDLFLTQLSRLFPHRVIVGYTVWGVVDTTTGSYTNPGNVPPASHRARMSPDTPRLSPWGDYAKWAFGGAIVRIPPDELTDSRTTRCANPRCPGHAKNTDRCPYKSWGNDPTLLKFNP